MKNIAVFASGRGSNFEAIVRAARNNRLRCNISLLVCDKPDAPVIAKAQKAKVEVALFVRKDFSCKEDFERAIISRLRSAKIELIVLAGFMRMLSPLLVCEYRDRIINIHPALLPAFKGEQAIRDAFDYGVRWTGVTVHMVDEEMDHGPVILQEPVEIKKSDTLETLEARIHRVEHQIYPEAIRLMLKGKLRIAGRKVIF
jgi:phosphoribosylglycinamide formyltransferase-1